MPYPDGGKARHKWRYDNDPDYREQKLAKNREWRKKNREKQVAYSRERRYLKKRERVDLLGGCCVGCGTSDISVLQFDHIDRSKKTRTVGRLRNDQVKEELDNCQLLCKRCHVIKTRVMGDNNEILKGYNLGSIEHFEDRIVITYELHKLSHP